MNSLSDRSISWNFEWATSWDEIWTDQYLQRWQSQFDTPSSIVPPSPFFHPNVVRVWIECVGGLRRVQPYFLLARSSSGHTVFLPLACQITSWKHGYVRRLRPVGDRYFDYHDPIVCGPAMESPDGHNALVDSFWREIENELACFSGKWFDALELPRIRSSFTPEMRHWPLADKAPHLDLTVYKDFDTFFRSRNKKLRGDTLRQIRRLSEKGELRFRVYNQDDAADVVAWIPRFEAMRRRRYPGSSLPEGYVERLVREACDPGPVHCSALLLNGIDISWHIGFYAHGVLYWYLPMYDHEYQAYSPGKVHIFYAIQSVFCRGGQMIDFLRGQESYKSGWTNGAEFRMHRLSRTSQTFASVARMGSAAILNKLGYLSAWVRRVDS